MVGQTRRKPLVLFYENDKKLYSLKNIYEIPCVTSEKELNTKNLSLVKGPSTIAFVFLDLKF